ncbi:MAG: hypothetical protein FWC87_08260 [Acidimicrobiaceae bacterium]|nr:hypothetical protein [Acidimicrobiaceae bacterium]
MLAAGALGSRQTFGSDHTNRTATGQSGSRRGQPASLQTATAVPTTIKIASRGIGAAGMGVAERPAKLTSGGPHSNARGNAGAAENTSTAGNTSTSADTTLAESTTPPQSTMPPESITPSESTTPSASTSAAKGPAGRRHERPRRAQPATFLGSYGTEARWVVTENAKPGTNSWRIPPGTTDPTIVGYADHTSAQVGEQVGLYVSTTAPSFQVAAYRMGYYGGTGARLIWQSTSLSGSTQDTCPVSYETYTVSCPWKPSLSVDITRKWVQGDYLLKLNASTGGASYIPLTIIDPTSHATYVILNSVLTWQAWNPYGGYDCFQDPTGENGPTDPYRSRVVSYDRPYDYTFSDGEGSADFLNLEYPAVRFAEEHGLDVTYLTDINLSVDPSLLEQHKALLSLGHNEFWTAGEREGLVNGLGDGVNLFFLGATPGLRPARLESSPLGPDRLMVAYRSAEEDPITSTDPALSTPNDWSDPPLEKRNDEIVGNTYGGYGINAPMVIVDPTAWPFARTGLRQGSSLAHLVAGDYDHYVDDGFAPQDVQILAHSPVETTYGTTGDADMLYYTVRKSDAGVVSTGTIGWVGFLNSCGPGVPCQIVQRITGNVLRLFGQGPSGTTEPSVSNTSDYSSDSLATSGSDATS